MKLFARNKMVWPLGHYWPLFFNVDEKIYFEADFEKIRGKHLQHFMKF